MYGQAGMAAGQQAAANTIREASLTGAIEDLDPIIKRTADYAERLEQLCGRFFGPSPTGVKQGGIDGSASIPVSLIHSLNSRRSMLAEQLNRVEQAITMIERVL